MIDIETFLVIRHGYYVVLIFTILFYEVLIMIWQFLQMLIDTWKLEM